jgi:hypothetical protein
MEDGGWMIDNGGWMMEDRGWSMEDGRSFDAASIR